MVPTTSRHRLSSGCGIGILGSMITFLTECHNESCCAYDVTVSKSVTTVPLSDKKLRRQMNQRMHSSVLYYTFDSVTGARKAMNGLTSHRFVMDVTIKSRPLHRFIFV